MVKNYWSNLVNFTIIYVVYTLFFKDIGRDEQKWDEINFRKPDKRHLTKTIEKLGLKKYKCLFVGDSLPDALCAKRTKSKLVLLSHGYSHENIDNMGADLILDSFSQFKKELNKLI